MERFRPRDDDYSVRDVKDRLDDFKDFLNYHSRGRGVWLLVLILLLVYLLSGTYIVGPGEKGVVLLFGKHLAPPTEPGLRYRLPAPFMTHMIVDVSKVRRAEIGYRSDANQNRSVPKESLMLTGDENIVDVRLLVQYSVRDPVKYLFGAEDPDLALRASTEVALRGVVGENTIDHTMTSGGVEVQDRVKKYLQELLDRYNTGLEVTQVRLPLVDPPHQVREAFHDVVRAWEDRERLIREAEGYREDVLPKARGQASREVKGAEAYRAQRIDRAKGDSERFTKVLVEYSKAPEVTRQRLYLESVEEFLPSARKFIIEGGKTSVLPLLPLTGVDAPAVVTSPGGGQPSPTPEKKGN
jgi:membrane protease subunit HflK